MNETMKCMTYFPVVVKISHLREIRSYISRLHNRSFDEVFRDIISPEDRSYSQFGIFCTYLFHFHRDDYEWNIMNETPQWDGQHPPPHPGQLWDPSLFTDGR